MGVRAGFKVFQIWSGVERAGTAEAEEEIVRLQVGDVFWDRVIAPSVWKEEDGGEVDVV